MRVNNTGSNPVQNSEIAGAKGTNRSANARGAGRPDPSEATNTSDSVKADISSRGRELAHAKELASSAPDVREDKIADLKRRIAEGKYKVDADGLADRMVSEHMSAGIG